MVTVAAEKPETQRGLVNVSPEVRNDLGMSPKKTALFAAKAIRLFAYSLISIALPLYLALVLHYSDISIGIVVAIAVGSGAIYNILVSKYADSFGRKKSLIALSLLMAVSGALFALNLGFYSIIVASLIGSICVNGTETGPFMNIEVASLTKFSNDSNRTITYSMYNFLGYAAASIGPLFGGAMLGFFNNSQFIFQILFAIYSIMALALALIYATFGEELEVKVKKEVGAPRLSGDAKNKILKLGALFSLDAFGGGFVVQSLITLWFITRFPSFPTLYIGIILSVANIITAFSIFMASWVAKRIGLLNTMVFTHAPSSVFLIAIPFAPTPLIAAMLLFLRQSMSQMDVPTRQSYMMAIVKPEERTATGSLINTPRTIAQALSPTLSGYFIQAMAYADPFVIGGSLKILYDTLIFFTFRKIKPPEETTNENARMDAYKRTRA